MSLPQDHPSRIWQLRTQTLRRGDLPLLMGIVNVTPDSFSDGGRFLDHRAAVDHAGELIEQGADIIDIGGESTRPYAEPVSAAEEIGRVLPVIEQLAAAGRVPVSIDTRKVEVARAALNAGAEVLNDVEGLRDERMRELAAEAQPGLCAMHMRGTPETMQDDPCYADVVEEVREYLAMRRRELIELGIPASRICIDPGIGFGKTTAHNVELLRHVGRFLEMGGPVLIGHSRKGFLGKLIGDPQAERAAATIGVSVIMALRGVTVLRIHDVGAVRRALICSLAVADQLKL